MSEATIDGTMRVEEVERRLPEVGLIEDPELYDQTMDALQRGVPEYFWDVPATSSTKFHNPYSRGRHGLHIHVKMTFSPYERMVRSYQSQGLLNEFEADAGRSALLLHDMLKYGIEYSEGDDTINNHDMLCGRWLRQNTELPKAVIGAVEAHNGPFYAGPKPSNPLEQLVHQSDMIASSKNVTPGIWKPASEILSRYPGIPQADL